jgi:hypothetical protein
MVVVVAVEVGVEEGTHKEVEDGAVAVILQAEEQHQEEEGGVLLKWYRRTSILHGHLGLNVMMKRWLMRSM